MPKFDSYLVSPAISRFLISTIALLLLGVVSATAADIVWTNPVPVGANPATFPVAQDYILPRVQANFDKTQGKQFDLIFDGDSITDQWQVTGKDVWAKYYGSIKAVDFGISGDGTENLLWRLSKGQVDGLDPKLVVLLIGTTNTGRDSDDQIVDGIHAAVSEYLKRCPHAQVLLLGLFPRSQQPTDPVRIKITTVNSKIASFAKEPRVTFLDIGAKFLAPDGSLTKDIMPDFTHPSEKGYQIWADAIQPVIEKYIPTAKK